MFIETIKTPGIAHLSYVLGSNGEACVIDPQLDTDKYLKISNKHNCRITRVFETHRNEDFISGSVALKQRTQAEIYHGEDADKPIHYAAIVKDKETFKVGSWLLTVLKTPGHTKDSICIVFYDANNSQDTSVGVFTGDTLFVHDVGRTDFYPKEKEHMASMLYDSLQRLIALGDQTIVYPAHGAGSVCGGDMAEREFTTIGIEKTSNPLLKLTEKASFIKCKVNENHYIAPYFSKMEQANSEGVDSPLPPIISQLLPSDAMQLWLDPTSRPGYLIDIRTHAAFRDNHIPGSINMPGDLLSAYGGWLLEYQKPIMFVAENSIDANASAAQLWRMGFTHVVGHISDIPIPVTKHDINNQALVTVTADVVEFRLQESRDNWILLDVRKHDEVIDKPLPGALHTYLGYMKEKQANFNADVHYTCMCGSGKRATVAASYLKHLGCNNVDVFLGSLVA